MGPIGFYAMFVMTPAFVPLLALHWLGVVPAEGIYGILVFTVSSWVVGYGWIWRMWSSGERSVGWVRFMALAPLANAMLLGGIEWLAHS